MLRAGYFHSLDNVTHAICSTDNFAVFKYPMQLVLGRGCLRECALWKLSETGERDGRKWKGYLGGRKGVSGRW